MFLTHISSKSKPYFSHLNLGKTWKYRSPPHFRENALKAHFLLKVILALEVTFVPKLHFGLKVQEEPAKRGPELQDSKTTRTRKTDQQDKVFIFKDWHFSLYIVTASESDWQRSWRFPCCWCCACAWHPFLATHCSTRKCLIHLYTF